MKSVGIDPIKYGILQVDYNTHIPRGEMVERNGGKFFTNLSDVADYLNGKPSFSSTINLRNRQKI